MGASETLAASAVGVALPPDAATPRLALEIESQLVQARLGVASSLFAAMQARHGPTAAHCLRVALGCSTWADAAGIHGRERDCLEIAALLHDVGKISIPDQVLLKPAKLSEREVAIIAGHQDWGLYILSHCFAAPEILDFVRFAFAWYDGSRAGFDRQGDDLPRAARMIAIVDAFDAMTTDQVYRRAMARERALAELFSNAGVQFDLELVTQFCALAAEGRVELRSSQAACEWLSNLDAAAVSQCLGPTTPPGAEDLRLSVESLFQQKLLESMHDAVVFVDPSLRILLWNRAAERLTGVSALAVGQQLWLPSLVDMRDERGRGIDDGACPVRHAIRSGVQIFRRLTIRGRKEPSLSVDVHVVPVTGADGVIYGAALLLHDASSQVTLEERVQSLQDRATKDPLTGLANRAEFDRTLVTFVETHLAHGLPCSLIICDIDHFKSINDTFGHQPGDEALIAFASLLKGLWRPGDLVARYGGEEFCALCADCDISGATQRAEAIRAELARTPQAMLEGRAMTASFGVTQIQPGDTPEALLRRADRALYQAKQAGRNRVIQLGAGGEAGALLRGGWPAWLLGGGGATDALLHRTLVTTVPLDMVVEKLRGFVADHHARIVSLDTHRVLMSIEGQQFPLTRRRSDRAAPFLIEIHFLKPSAEQASRGAPPTGLRVAIRPRRGRDRRRDDALERAKQIFAGIKAYLMAHEMENAEDS